MKNIQTDSKIETNRKLYKDINLQLIFGVTLIVVLGVTSISPAFPKIARELKISFYQVALLVTVFTLPGIFLSPIIGFMADRYGRKIILVPSLFIFGLAGGSCFFFRNFELLLLMRFIQGVGAAALGSINLTIMGDLYSGRELTTAMGYNSSVLSIGTAVYPVIGGALAMIGWNYPFILPFLAVPIGLLVIFLLDNPEPRNKEDIATYIKNLWNDVKQPKIIGLFIAIMITFIILYGPILTYFPLLMEQSFGATAFIIGLFMTTTSITNAFTAAHLGRLSRRFTELKLIRAGFLLYLVILILLPFISNIWAMLIPTILYGIANGINIPCILSLLTGEAPTMHRAAFMSINGMVLRIGQTAGPLLMGLSYSIWGLYYSFIAAACFVLLMFLLIVYLLTRHSETAK